MCTKASQFVTCGRSPTGPKEEEKSRLQQLTAELLLAQGKLATLEADQQAKAAELKAVQTKQETESVTYVRSVAIPLPGARSRPEARTRECRWVQQQVAVRVERNTMLSTSGCIPQSDVLKSQQREQDTLQESVKALEHRLAVAHKQIATLKSELSIAHVRFCAAVES